MSDFWQQLCNKNIVQRASSAFACNIGEKPVQDSSQIQLFAFTEDNLPTVDCLIKNNKTQNQNNNEKKTGIKTSLKIKFDGQKLDMQGIVSENSDGTMSFKGTKKISDTEQLTYEAVINDKGEIVKSVTSSKKVNQQGETIAYRNEYRSIDGRCEADFYEENSHTKLNDDSVKVVTGHEEWFEDKYGQTNEVKYVTQCKDKKTGALELTHNGVGGTDGIREHLLDCYEWANSVYQGSVQERGEGKGISRACIVSFDENGQASFVQDTDCITLVSDKEGQEPLKFSTDSFENLTSVSLASSDNGEVSTEFSDIPEIIEPTLTTDINDIIKNGGDVVHVMADGTTKTEFYKEIDGEIIVGYTLTDTKTSLVLDDYRETYDKASESLKSKQQLQYNKNTGKHEGERQVFDNSNSVERKYAYSYYIQGTIGDTLRYTTGSFDVDRQFIPDGMEDTVKFEQADKEYSVAQLKNLLVFQNDYSRKKE